MAINRVGGQIVCLVRTPEPEQIGGNHPPPCTDQGLDGMPPQKRPGRIAMEQQHRVSRPRPLVDTGAAALRRGDVARLVRPEAIEGPIHLSCWVCHISSTQASLLACDFLSWNPLLFLSRSYVARSIQGLDSLARKTERIANLIGLVGQKGHHALTDLLRGQRCS